MRVVNVEDRSLKSFVKFLKDYRCRIMVEEDEGCDKVVVGYVHPDSNDSYNDVARYVVFYAHSAPKRFKNEDGCLIIDDIIDIIPAIKARSQMIIDKKTGDRKYPAKYKGPKY